MRRSDPSTRSERRLYGPSWCLACINMNSLWDRVNFPMAVFSQPGDKTGRKRRYTVTEHERLGHFLCFVLVGGVGVRGGWGVVGGSTGGGWFGVFSSRCRVLCGGSGSIGGRGCEGMMWWAWHQSADASHPMHFRSRATRAMRWAGLAIRLALPRSNGWEVPRKMAGNTFVPQANSASLRSITGTDGDKVRETQ